MPALAVLLSVPAAPVSGGAVSFVSFRKNDGAHGHSSASYGIQHGSGGQSSARVHVLQSNLLGAAAGPLGPGPAAAGVRRQVLPSIPVHPQPAPLPLITGGVQLGPNGVIGGPPGLTGHDGFGPLAGQAGFGGPRGGSGGPGGPAGLSGPAGPVGARLVHPGGPPNGPTDGPIGGPAGLSDRGLIRLRADPSNRVGVNGRAPVQDSLPRPALRTVAGTPVWVPSYSNEPPSYEK